MNPLTLRVELDAGLALERIESPSHEIEIVPLSGFGAFPKRFRSALERRLELARVPISITGADSAERKSRVARRRAQKSPGN